MTAHRFDKRKWARWVGTFIGFPLSGVVARLAAGDIDTVTAAGIGGLAGGATLGAFQAWIGGMPAEDRSRWVAATAVGLAVGLAAGAGTVGYQTDTASLVVMGAVSGAFVGLAQALSVPMRRIDRILWATATPVLWAGGWLATSQIIVDADRQHAMFGGPGSLVVAAIAGVLYGLRQRPDTSADVYMAASIDRAAA
jgi:hypothetical protein